MKSPNKVLTSLAFACLFVTPAFGVITADVQLVDRTTAQNLNNFVRYNSVVESVDVSTTDPGWTVRFTGLWGTFGRQTATPWNWSAYNGFTLIIENLENVPVVAGVRVDFTPDIYDASRRQSDKFILPPRAVRRIVLELDSQQGSPYGVKAIPSGYNGPHLRLFGNKLVDRSRAYFWSVALNQSTPARLKISQIHVIQNSAALNGILDGFGQTSDHSWTGKPASVADLQQQLSLEIANLNAFPGPANIYGPTAPVGSVIPGRWNVTRLPSGKWYLVAPNGKLFWSFGINAADYQNSGTPVSSRAYLFQSLPPNSGSTAVHYLGGGTLFNFHSYNVSRKFGTNWQSAYITHANRRIRSWGFNTVGDWANDGIYPITQVPYVLGLSTDTYPTRLTAPFRDSRRVPDPFGADFQAFMTNYARQQLLAHIGRPLFLGTYVDLELRWYNREDTSQQGRYQIALAALNAPFTQPAKAAILLSLQKAYKFLSTLNSAWGTNFSSWTAMQGQNILPNPSMSAGMVNDLARFSHEYAAAYYGKIRAALQVAGSTGLYLGARDWYTPLEFVQEANRYVDVFSIAQYSNPEFMDWTFPDLTRPLLISETSFGASDRGTWHPGHVSCYDQQDRANRMIAYYQRALASPKVIGAHWFNMVDQHPSGRPDKENQNVGFVSIADTPYQEMVDAARYIGNNVYAWRGQ